MKSNLDILLALAALAAAALALWNLSASDVGLDIEHTQLQATPVTVYRERGAGPRPVVLIGHGLTGSQQLMQPIAVTLARNGYMAVTYDLLGHGASTLPLHDGRASNGQARAQLLRQMEDVARFALVHEGSDQRLALVGHGLSADLAVRLAVAYPQVSATVAVSMLSPAVTPDAPRNLLVVAGAFQPGLEEQALAAVQQSAAGAAVRPGHTVGDPTLGSARRAVFTDDFEQVGVLYSETTLGETLDWMNATFGQGQRSHLDTRGPSVLLLLAALVVLARPLTRLLPVVSRRALGTGLDWLTLVSLTIGPALGTPLLLWLLPTDFLPVLLADYLGAHLLLYGLLTWVGLRMHARGRRRRTTGASEVSMLALLAGAALISLYGIGVIGSALDAFVTAFTAIPARLPLMAIMLVGALVYFCIDEWMIRGEQYRPGAYLATKTGLCLSLGMAVALDSERLLYVSLLMPLIVAVLIVQGLFSAWAYQRCRHPLVGGISGAMLLTWSVGVTVPLLGGS